MLIGKTVSHLFVPQNHIFTKMFKSVTVCADNNVGITNYTIYQYVCENQMKRNKYCMKNITMDNTLVNSFKHNANGPNTKTRPVTAATNYDIEAFFYK